MRSWRTMYESNTDYMSAADIPDGSDWVTLTVQRIDEQTIKGEKGDQRRPVVYWRENVKPLIVNKTNILLFEAIFGDDPDAAIGKPVSIRFDPTVKRSGEKVGGLRLCGAPGFRARVVRVKLPKKAPTDYSLMDTAPKVDPAAARAKLLEAAESNHGTDEATVRAWLAEQGGADFDAMTVDDLRDLFRALSDIAAWAAEQDNDSADDGGEYVE